MSILTDLYSLLIPRCCPVCRNRLSPNESFICLECSVAWPSCGIEDISDNRMVRQLWSFFPVVYGASLIRYRSNSPFHNILMSIKYNGHTDLAETLGRWGAHEFDTSPLREWTDVVVPVPLSRLRRLRRGYNQALMIARGVADEYQVPVAQLLRRKESPTQKHLSAHERLTNVQGIYSARIPEHWKGKHILLVDDVMTTGATLSACAQAILDADPSASVSVFTLALSE